MKQIRLAVIGCGGFFRNFHASPLARDVPEFRLVAVVDPVAANRKALRREHFPGKRIKEYDDHRTMLKEVQPDAVMVSSPHTLHFRHCYDAIRAGAHAMVEKPMVTSSADARKLVTAADKAGKVMQIAIQGTYTDTFAYARKLLSDGTMGPLQLVTGVLAQGWLKGTAGKWRQDPKLSGGGQLYDSTAHVLSAMMYLVDSPVREVFCWADNKGSRVDINAVGCVRFANECMGTITSGGNCSSWYSHLILQGANASMEISPHGGNFRVNGTAFKKDITGVPRGWKIPTVTCVQNFADAILGKQEARCGGRLGMLLADLMDGLYASVASGKPVKV